MRNHVSGPALKPRLAHEDFDTLDLREAERVACS
jgi:hypothetical protein